MAQIRASTLSDVAFHVSLGNTAFASWTSVSIVLCMIISLVGIKIWWFKHRLDFDQTSTQNGAAGGTQPTVVTPRHQLRQHTSKDKRYSQEISDTVEVHGVFRLRPEDDSDIVRSNRLPPIRIRKASGNRPPLILPPPRPPEKPDEKQSPAAQRKQSPLLQLDSSAVTKIETENNNNKGENGHPIPPNRLNRSHTTQVQPAHSESPETNSTSDPEFGKLVERKPTEVDSYDGVSLRGEFAERRPTSYIRYEEVDVEQDWSYIDADVDVNECQAQARKVVTDLDGLQIPKEPKSVTFRMRDSDDGEGEGGTRNLRIMTRRPTGFVRSHEDIWEEVQELANLENKEIGHAIETDDSWNNQDWTGINNPKETFRFSEDDQTTGKQENTAITSRRPTGFVKTEELENLFNDKENHTQTSGGESFNCNELWNTTTEEQTSPQFGRNIESRVVEDSNNIPQCSVKFNTRSDKRSNDSPWITSKTRGNTEEFESNLGAKASDGHNALKTRRPTGFVRNTDDLWRDLNVFNDTGNTWFELEKDIDKSFVHNVEEEFTKVRHSYELNEADFLELQEELDNGAAPIPKGFGKTIDEDWENFRNLEEIKETKETIEIQQPNPLAPGAPAATTDYSSENSSKSILKERRSTGFVRRDEGSTIGELDNNNRFSPESRAKPRKSKVTFDFKTEKHYISPHESETESDKEKDETHQTTTEITEYMQRCTKADDRPQNSSTIKPLPFSSPTPQSGGTMCDSWSAIRKHRYLTEAFRNFALSNTAGQSEEPPPLPPSAPPTSPFTSTFRNPLAQSAVHRHQAVAVITDPGGSKPRTIRDMKKAQSTESNRMLNIAGDHAWSGSDA